MSSRPRYGRHGVTLAELLVVLVILGISLAGSAIAVTALRPAPVSAAERRFHATRAEAIRSGRSAILIDSTGASIRLLPDGRVLGDNVDPVTGSLLDSARTHSARSLINASH